MFVWHPLNFWLLMSISTSVLAIISFYFVRPIFPRKEITWINLFYGISSAVVLYILFWLGNKSLILISELLPDLLPHRSENLQSIYANRGILPPYIVGLLLFFPIGFGEEIFWRGFIQRYFSIKWTGLTAVLLTTLLYTAVHLVTANPVLILAALTCGFFWSVLYWLTGALFPVLVSHMLWDPAIFIIWPIQ